MRVSPFRAGWFPALAGVCALLLSGTADAAEFMPHRAVYALSKGGGRTAQSVSALRGSMLIEMDESCDGWSLSQRIRMEVTDSMDSDVESDSRYASFETKDGKSLRFAASDWQNGSMVEETAGTAERPAPDQPGTITFVKPRAETFVLPARALFPSAFNLEILALSTKGDAYHSLVGFDGGNMEGAYTISVFIGKERESEAKLAPDLVKAAGEALAGPVRNVRVAYFPTASKSSEPELEYEMELLANGVSPQLRLEYQRYQVRAVLVEFKELARPRCAR